MRSWHIAQHRLAAVRVMAVTAFIEILLCENDKLPIERKISALWAVVSFFDYRTYMSSRSAVIHGFAV